MAQRSWAWHSARVAVSFWYFFAPSPTFAAYQHAPDSQVPIVMEDTDSFGIGLDFTPSYGAIAVSYANGTNIPLGTVPGDEAWWAMLSDMSKITDWQGDQHASWTVPLIAKMIRKLRMIGEQKLGVKILKASVGLPAHEAVSHWWQPVRWTIQEAFASEDLGYIDVIPVPFGYNGESLMFPHHSVLAGYGLGLCQPYTSNRSCLIDQCGSDFGQRPAIYYLVGCYRNALEVTMTPNINTAYGTIGDAFPNYHLGTDMRHQNPNEEYYWEEVRKQLMLPFVDFYRPESKPDRVLFYGEMSGDQRLREMVMEVIAMFVEDHGMPAIIDLASTDFTVVGALGAAELAKRNPYFWCLKRGSWSGNTLTW